MACASNLSIINTFSIKSGILGTEIQWYSHGLIMFHAFENNIYYKITLIYTKTSKYSCYQNYVVVETVMFVLKLILTVQNFKY